MPVGKLELALQRLGHAAIDVPPPAAQLFPRADQLDAALLKRLLGSGTSRSGSNVKNSPRPLHSRHMPCGLLKLNSCGLGGSKLRLQCVQA